MSSDNIVTAAVHSNSPVAQSSENLVIVHVYNNNGQFVCSVSVDRASLNSPNINYMYIDFMDIDGVKKTRRLEVELDRKNKIYIGKILS